MECIIFESAAEQSEGGVKNQEIQWIDIVRTDTFTSADLPEKLQESLHENHFTDIYNSSHPPYYEICDNYELVIFSSIDQRIDIVAPKTRSIAFIITD